MWIATDPDHTARAAVLARIALGSQGIRVGPADWPTPSSGERRKLLRDGLRLTLWRATGSTGAWLAQTCCPQTGSLWGVGVGSQRGFQAAVGAAVALEAGGLVKAA